MPKPVTQPSDCANLLKILADETRLTVVRQLMRGPRRVGEINETLRIEQSLLSHHLRVLRDGGIVEAHRDGKAVLYCLSPRFKNRGRAEGIDLGCCQLTFHGQGHSTESAAPTKGAKK